MRNSAKTIVPDTTAAARSAKGPAYMIPSIPQKSGRRTIKGSRKMICLVRDRKIPFFGLPMDVNKLDDTGCTQFKKVNNIYIRKYDVAKSKYSLEPEPNMDIICLGKIWKDKKAVVDTTRPERIAIL